MKGKMAKGKQQIIVGFTQLERAQVVAAVAKKLARVLSQHPADIANEALGMVYRPTSVPEQVKDLVQDTGTKIGVL